MYHGALVSGFVNIWVYFNKLVNKLNHLIDFLKKTKILLVIQSENQSATSSLSDQLLILPLIHCSTSGDDSRKLGKGVGEQGWRSGESTRLPAMWPGFESWRRRHMQVEFVVGSLPCSERFFSGYSGFSLSLKTNTFKFQFDLERTDTFQRALMNSLVLRG